MSRAPRSTRLSAVMRALSIPVLLIASACTTTRSAAPARSGADAMDAYYLSTCAVCGGLLGARGETPERSVEGRHLRVCSESCREYLEGDPSRVIARVDAVMIADQRPWYPLTTSLVSGRPLGSRPVEFIWGNRLFRVVDAGEQRAVLADPSRFIRDLDRAAIAAQAPHYGMPDKCPVQGDILENDTPIDIVVGGRMVRVCCLRCVRVVRARPQQYLSMVEYANRHRQEEASPGRQP